MSETLDQTGGAPARPTFITVLCILTFVGTGIGIVSALMNFASPYGSLISGWQTYNIVIILANLLCLFGGLQMWKLKKTGYFIYAAGQLAAIVSAFIFLGTAFLFGPFGMMVLVSIVIFPALFLILYGLNLKHMN